MIERIVIKNPGCEFCRFYLEPFDHHGKQVAGSCLKGARLVYQKPKIKGKKRRWKWSDCSYSEEKNKSRLCKDFKIQSLFLTLIQYIRLFIIQAGEQQPPTYRKEIWWDS
jgi:hypothetical protein